MLEKLIYILKSKKSLIEKLEILNDFLDKKKFDAFFNENKFLQEILNFQTIEEEYVAKVLFILNQLQNIFLNTHKIEIKYKELCKYLIKIENFYSPLGGILGYHNKFLSLLKERVPSKFNFYPPKSFDIKIYDESLLNIAVKNLDKLALICPMGGAGDRLNLICKTTQKPLPAAKLKFSGKTLVELLIDDIRSLEYLFYKKFNKELIIPIIIMTSDEKNNFEHIYSIFKENNFFERGKESFLFIKQLSVPLITPDGNWAITEPFKVATKPSGHGVIWKLMIDNDAFDFLKKLGKTKGLVRQINNPIANTDNTLLSFIGLGFKHDKKFGFLSCERDTKYKEGLNILKEKKDKVFNYNFSNVEYTEFEKQHISNNLDNLNFPANTNTLFVDLSEIYKTTYLNPFPEFIINLKTDVYEYSKDKKATKIKAGRLESMMQNISDFIIDSKDQKITDEEQLQLKTYIALQNRDKTISTTKKSFHIGGDVYETPEKCFFDLLKNGYDLLKNYCNSKLIKLSSLDNYILNGPSFIFIYNPILGPLYSTISKKIVSCKFKGNFELNLNISEVLLENIFLNGSLIIDSKITHDKKFLKPKCILKDVKIDNKGIDRNKKNIYWKNKIYRHELL
ncbi:MAG: hypothetical protein A2888_00325, partial [Chlamydiae bacterium RIFCSPLOWO2_01_FULL_28_7]